MPVSVLHTDHPIAKSGSLFASRAPLLEDLGEGDAEDVVDRVKSQGPSQGPSSQSQKGLTGVRVRGNRGKAVRGPIAPQLAITHYKVTQASSMVFVCS